MEGSDGLPRVEALAACCSHVLQVIETSCHPHLWTDGTYGGALMAVNVADEILHNTLLQPETERARIAEAPIASLDAPGDNCKRI